MNTLRCKKSIVLILMVFLAACSGEDVKEPMDEVTLQLVWKHQTQFAGFYAADINGFYKDENIQVTIRPRLSPSFDVISSVVKGDADFGVNQGVGLIEARGKKMPVTAIASIYQRYPLSFISLQKKGITHPLDFVGRKFRTLTHGGTTVVFNLLLKKSNIERENILFVQTGYDLDRLFSGEIDVWAGYTINEVLIAQQKGVAINQIKPEDFGINMMGDTLFTSDILLNTNPELVQRFVRATVRGWQWAVEHPEAAAKMALQFDDGLDLAHQVAMMKASIPYIHASVPVGMMDDAVWQEVHNAILEQGVIEKPLNLTAVYTNTFVEKMYQDGENATEK